MYYKKIFYLGDIHGYWNIIPKHLTENDESEICYIQVGDFGVGFYPYDTDSNKLIEINEILLRYNSKLLIIRGNHDDPSWFKDDNFTELKSQLTNITFVQDYTTLNINGENYLFIGGGISIDRIPRKMDKSITWWKDEVINFDFNKAYKTNEIDKIVCHISPDFCEPLKFNQLVYSYARNDSKLLDDLIFERSNMTKLINIILKNNNIKKFIYGHYHRNYRFNHNNCEFIGLEINKFLLD